jgi:ABC-type multidrug transport system fused ATPase/permease subunit
MCHLKSKQVKHVLSLDRLVLVIKSFHFSMIDIYFILLGKSTCINLLERFYDPTEGKILIDGREIQEYDHKYLHKKLAMVGQEPVLFNRTIRENIHYAMNNSDDKIIIQAAEQANAHGFITELTNGYNTKCGQRGGHLSG